MSRKLRALGIALSAILVAGAVLAASGWGEEEEGGGLGKPKRFKVESAPAILSGNQAEITTSLTAEAGEIVCNETFLDGTVANEEEKELKLTPSYKGCSAFGLSAHYKPNGCYYLFTLEPGRTFTGAEGSHTPGPVHIECPSGKEITIDVTLFGVFCTISIPEQTPEAPTVDMKNLGAGKSRQVLFTSTVAGINYKVTGGLGFCGNTTEPLIDGELDSVITVAAYKDEGGAKGAQTGFWIYGDKAP